MTATTRRSALTALASAPALAIPAFATPSTSSPHHSDAELFALQPEIEAADYRFNVALDAQNRAEERTFPRPPRPAQPEPSFVKEDWFQTFKEKMAELNANPNPSPEWAAYDVALKAWEEEIARIDLETGAAAACDHADDLLCEVDAICDKIIAIRATTLAGLKFKAKYVAEHDPDAPSLELLDSIIADILEMED
jgi:hypothetical protein